VSRPRRERREPWRWYALFLVVFAATLWAPLYDRAEPAVLGFPFFYFWLFLWVPVTAALSGVVYLAVRRRA
jgi:hypothetical protein